MFQAPLPRAILTSFIEPLEIVKKIDPNIKTVVGGQHFTALANESLENYREIDFIVRGEGELTLLDLIKNWERTDPQLRLKEYPLDTKIKYFTIPHVHLLKTLDDLPFPGYHFIEDHMDKYHFKMMADSNAGYAMVEASRGCFHKCTFCSQWPYWGGRWRTKSPKRIADEMEHIYNEYDIVFLWLTDDNLGLGKRTNKLCEELIKKGVSEDITWFIQARSDDIVRHKKILPKLRKAGNYWVMAGLERHDDTTIDKYHKGINPHDSKFQWIY